MIQNTENYENENFEGENYEVTGYIDSYLAEFPDITLSYNVIVQNMIKTTLFRAKIII